MNFSQRSGLIAAVKVVQREGLDADLRNSLWNALSLVYWTSYKAGDYHGGETKHSNLYPLLLALWLHYFKKPIDDLPRYWSDSLDQLRGYFFKAPWNQAYDFIEFVAEYGPRHLQEQFIQISNRFLERENAAYRFVSGAIMEITSSEEVGEIELAIAKSHPFSGVKEHLTTAISLMTNRERPDYRNSIKESISAVEALAKKIAQKDSATLGSILAALEKAGKLHPALKSSFSALYGYTSDAQGIRHALLEESTVSKAEARFMLICCSAFVNYAIEAIA